MTTPDPTATLAALDFAPECVATGCTQPATWRFVATHLDTWNLCIDELECDQHKAVTTLVFDLVHIRRCDHGLEIVWRFDTLEVRR